jgi:hypothetical protein
MMAAAEPGSCVRILNAVLIQIRFSSLFTVVLATISGLVSTAQLDSDPKRCRSLAQMMGYIPPA